MFRLTTVSTEATTIEEDHSPDLIVKSERHLSCLETTIAFLGENFNPLLLVCSFVFIHFESVIIARELTKNLLKHLTSVQRETIDDIDLLRSVLVRKRLVESMHIFLLNMEFEHGINSKLFLASCCRVDIVPINLYTTSVWTLLTRKTFSEMSRGADKVSAWLVHIITDRFVVVVDSNRPNTISDLVDRKSDDNDGYDKDDHDRHGDRDENDHRPFHLRGQTNASNDREKKRKNAKA